jgi:site-specific recombinase XerD
MAMSVAHSSSAAAAERWRTAAIPAAVAASAALSEIMRRSRPFAALAYPQGNAAFPQAKVRVRRGLGAWERFTASGDITLGRAVDAYLATLSGAEQASTRRTYGRVLRWIVSEFGSDAAPKVDAERFAGWFGARWGDRAPSTWNVSLDAIRSAAAYWHRQGWITADPSRMLVRRKPRPDRVRALSRAYVGQLLTREDISLRERTLWRMLYETAARSAEVLALDVEDLDLPNRCARVRCKGGAIYIVVWQTGTARLLPRPLKGRMTGSVFVTERKARVQLPAADLDEHGRGRLSYQQAEALFTKAPGDATLHQLSHLRADPRC